MAYLLVKSFHIFFIASWFAGLFYLPRIFVNLAMVPPGSEAVGLGLWLWIGFRIGWGPGNGWMHAKLVVVLLTIGYHHGCGVILKKFEADTMARSHVWFRWFNEAPVLLMLATIILVVLKPF